MKPSHVTTTSRFSPCGTASQKAVADPTPVLPAETTLSVAKPPLGIPEHVPSQVDASDFPGGLAEAEAKPSAQAMRDSYDLARSLFLHLVGPHQSQVKKLRQRSILATVGGFGANIGGTGAAIFLPVMLLEPGFVGGGILLASVGGTAGATVALANRLEAKLKKRQEHIAGVGKEQLAALRKAFDEGDSALKAALAQSFLPALKKLFADDSVAQAQLDGIEEAFTQLPQALRERTLRWLQLLEPAFLEKKLSSDQRAAHVATFQEAYESIELEDREFLQPLLLEALFTQGKARYKLGTENNRTLLRLLEKAPVSAQTLLRGLKASLDEERGLSEAQLDTCLDTFLELPFDERLSVLAGVEELVTQAPSSFLKRELRELAQALQAQV